MKRPDKVRLFNLFDDKDNSYVHGFLFGASWWSGQEVFTINFYFLIWSLEVAWHGLH